MGAQLPWFAPDPDPSPYPWQHRPQPTPAEPPIGDTLFFASHRDRDGKPLLHPHVAGLVLAGGLLIELALAERLHSHDKVLHTIEGPEPGDILLRRLLAEIESEPAPLPVRDWLDYLSTDAVVAVGNRLARAGRVDAGRWARRGRFVPVDVNDAGWQSAKITLWLDREELETPSQVAVAALVQAAGLFPHLFVESIQEASDYVDYCLRSLKPELAALIAEVDVAVGKAIVGRRI